MKFKQLFIGLFLASSIFLSAEETASSFDTAEKQVVTLSLRHAIEAATITHPSIKAAEIDIEIAKTNEKAAWAGYLPSISMTTSAYGDKNSGTAQITSTISGSQFLLGGAGPKQIAKQAEIDRTIATITKSATQQSRRSLTETLFLTAWLKQEEKKLLELSFQASQEALHEAKRKFETGLITEVDYKAQIALTSTAETLLESHKDELLSAIADLEEVTGLTMSNDKGVFAKLMWQPNIDQAIKPISFYTDLAFKNRLELEINDAAKQRAKADEALAKGQLMPTLSAVTQFSCGYSPGSTPSNPDVAENGLTQKSFFAGVQSSWNIFDRNASKYQAEIARAKALKSSTDREVIKRKIKKEVTKIHSDLKLAQKQAKSLQAQLAKTNSTQEQQKQFFAAGLITTAQTKTADADNYKTQFACLGQVVTFERSLCALNAACGYAPEVAELTA